MNEGGGSPLGAYILAVLRLKPDEETAREIAELVGLDTREAPCEGTAGRAGDEPPTTTTTTTSGSSVPYGDQPWRKPGTADDARTEAGIARLTGDVNAWLIVKKRGASSPVAAPEDAQRDRLEAEDWNPRPLPFEPLFRPVATRALVTAALARPRLHGAIDVDRLVDRFARGWPILEIPRARRWALPGRTRILLDCGPGLGPFSRDADDLVDRIAAVTSRDRTEVLTFWQTPALVGPSRAEAGPMALPHPGTTVVAVTDLGIARTGSAVRGLHQAWLNLAEALEDRDCPLVVFVPYPPERWPEPLAEELTLLTWDRATSIADVLAAVRA